MASQVCRLYHDVYASPGNVLKGARVVGGRARRRLRRQLARRPERKAFGAHAVGGARVGRAAALQHAQLRRQLAQLVAALRKVEEQIAERAARAARAAALAAAA